MPRYFFDVHEGKVRTPDEIGTELERLDVPREARRLLLELTKDLLIVDDRFRVEVTVRDGESPVHWSSLVLDRGWLPTSAS